MLLMHTPQGFIDLDADPVTWGAPNWVAIAVSLGRLVRWCGQGSRPYTVAEHSIRVASILPARLKLAGLLHDAAEAFIGDIPAPLRRAGKCGGFENYDGKISAWLFSQAGILSDLSSADLWAADQIMAATEYRDLLGGDPSVMGAEPLAYGLGIEWRGTDWGAAWLQQLSAEIVI